MASPKPKQVTVEFFDIEWDVDTDGEQEAPTLPSQVTRTFAGSRKEVKKMVEDRGADILSDEFGWCIHSLEHRIV